MTLSIHKHAVPYQVEMIVLDEDNLEGQEAPLS